MGSCSARTVVDAPAGAEKDRFTSLDALALAREIRALGRIHLDKAFDVVGGGYALTLRATARGRRELVLLPGRYGALLASPVAHPEEPGPMARELRRLLFGAVVTEVREPAGERYLDLGLARSDSPEPLTLAVEFFGTGNVVVARGPKIVAVEHPKTWAHRSLRIGADYVRPPSKGDPFSRTIAELEAALTSSRSDRASTLAARLSFGGPIAEELLARAELPGSVPAPESARAAAEALHRAIAELLAEVGDEPRGYLYSRDGAVVDVEPFRSRRWSEIPAIQLEELPTFSEACHRYFGEVTPRAADSGPTPEEARAAELERQLAQQQSAIDALVEEIRQRNAQAEAIYAHYAEAERLRAEAAKADPSRDETEVRLGVTTVPLRLRGSIDESARALYDASKRAQAKLAGARAALDGTRSRQRLPDSGTGRTLTRATTAPERKPHWFEQYRWFFTSEGRLVIGGRDASSNDRIVKRYLKPGDRYFHAEIQGAASVILKHAEGREATPPSEGSLREAAQWAVVYSKAWRGGLASASAFWVEPEQVSKAAASGEFVARGAWVIHGTKNYLRELTMEIGLGTVNVDGAERWCAAPPSALRSRGRLRTVLVPGEDRERSDREVELARELGIPRPVLQSLLPAGGIAARRA